jgi:hypothetical protein
MFGYSLVLRWVRWFRIGAGSVRVHAIYWAFVFWTVQASAESAVVSDPSHDVFPIPLFSGRLAVLPDPAQPDLRRSEIGWTLAELGLERDVVYLTAEQMVDPAIFHAEAFPVALHLGGESYWRTVREPEDGDAALQRHLNAGGRLLVLPYGPLPFYYDQRSQHVGSAARFGMRMGVGGFQSAPEGRTLAFRRSEEVEILGELPEQFRFPLPFEADQRWRPISGAVGEGTSYQPWITLYDETGRSYEDGAAAVRFGSGGRLVYVWCSLMACRELRRKILLAALRYALEDLTPPPARLACIRTLEAPAVDGSLDESIWRAAPVARPFVAAGELLRQAPHPTAVQACWDDTGVYLAVRCQVTQAAAEAAADVIDVWLVGTVREATDALSAPSPCPLPGGARGHRTVISRTVLGEGAAEPQLRLTLDADNRLEIRSVGSGEADEAAGLPGDGSRIRSAVQRCDESWTAEIAIPFAVLPGARPPYHFGDFVRAQFVRRVQKVGATEEPSAVANLSVWSAGEDPERAERFGALVLSAHPLADDFRSYPPSADGSDQWTFSGGSWRIEDGALVGQDGCEHWSRLRGALRGGESWRDYGFSARFRVESRGSDPNDGPWFGVRASAEGDGYVLQFGAEAWHLHKVVFGAATGVHNCLAQGAWTPGDGWHTLRLEMRGNRIQGMLDDRWLFDVKDDAHQDLPSRRRGGIVLVPGRSPRSQGSTIVRYDEVAVSLWEE